MKDMSVRNKKLVFNVIILKFEVVTNEDLGENVIILVSRQIKKNLKLIVVIKYK